MNITEINKLLSSNFPNTESFEKNATWENDIKGKSINKFFAKEFAHKLDWDYISKSYNINEDFIRFNQDNVNWISISYRRTLSEEFIKEFKSKVDWSGISWGQKLSENFIDEFEDNLNWSNISSRQILSEGFIEKFLEKGTLCFSTIEKSQKLSEEFILRHINSIHFNIICQFQILTENFINSYFEHFDLGTILIYQNISNDFIDLHNKEINWRNFCISIKEHEKKYEVADKCIDYIDWDYISSNWTLSDDHIRKYQNKVDWYRISNSQKLSENIIREFQDKLNWYEISQRCKISENFIEELQDKVIWEKVGSQYECSLSFIRKHKDKLKNAILKTDDIELIRELKSCITFNYIDHSNYSEELLIEFQDKVIWELLVKTKKMSEQLLKSCSGSFNSQVWGWISDLQPLSEEFIREFQDKVHWGGISCHQTLSENFMDEFEDKIWWEWDYIPKFQKLSAEFIERKTQQRWKGKKYIMLPYQKNMFCEGLLESLTSKQQEVYLQGSWLYKTTEFKKEQVVNLNLFVCHEEYFISTIVVDENRYSPHYFHNKFVKGGTFEIFATPTNEGRSKGFEVGNFENICNYHGSSISEWKEKYISVKVKIRYEDVVHIVGNEITFSDIKKSLIVRCKKILVLE